MGAQWTDKREALLRHYISNGFNATKAAEAAGYSCANQQGPYLVNLGIFRTHLAAALAEAGISEEEIRYRLTRVARKGIAEFFRMKEKRDGIEVDWDKLVNSPDRDLVHRIRIGADGAVTIEGGDRMRALELLGKSLGMFAERVINEQPEQAVSNAALEQARLELEAFEAESGAIVKDWRRRVAGASGALALGSGAQDPGEQP